MWFYIARRFNLFVLTVAILYLLVFIMNQALPGDPLANLSDPRRSSWSASKGYPALGAPIASAESHTSRHGNLARK